MRAKELAGVSFMLCASTAMAQSSVTLYGVIDNNVEYVNKLHTTAGDGSRLALQSGWLSGSRWGLRGTEDLGNGLSALFVLESGFNGDDGKSGQGGRLFGRQAYVGLKSATAGQLTFGRQYTTLFTLLGNFEPLFYSLYSPLTVLEGLNYRSDNTAVYTGTFGGLTAQAHWTFGNNAASVNPGPGGDGEIPGQFRRGTGYGGGLAYISGPFGATIIYDQYNPSVALGGGAFSSGSVRKAAAAGSYTIGPAKLMAGYRWGQNKNVDDSVALRDDYYWIGGNYQATSALNFTLEYAYQKIKTINSAESRQPNPWQVAFVADYNFSKRTDIYLTTAYARHAALMLDQAGVNANADGYTLATGKNSMFGAALGIRHKF